MGGVAIDEQSQTFGRLLERTEKTQEDADKLFKLVGELQHEQSQTVADVRALTAEMRTLADELKTLVETVRAHERLSAQAVVISWAWKVALGAVVGGACTWFGCHWPA